LTVAEAGIAFETYGEACRRTSPLPTPRGRPIAAPERFGWRAGGRRLRPDSGIRRANSIRASLRLLAAVFSVAGLAVGYRDIQTAKGLSWSEAGRDNEVASPIRTYGDIE
jgi:hypothetical protein